MPRRLAVPRQRRAPLAAILQRLDAAQRIVLTTHVNADGDGAGSEAALAAWLTQRGKSVTILNPTPFPRLYRYLVEQAEQIVEAADPRAAEVAANAELFVVLDTSEARRLGRVMKLIGGRAAVVVDHHPPAEPRLASVSVQDPSACATGELIYDLLLVAGADQKPWPARLGEALYVAIVTDTGSFRFANTTPRTHLITADLIERGVDPEAVYRRLFATVPLQRVQLLRSALETLEVDPELPITWISIGQRTIDELGATAEDLDGIVEHARSIEGTEVAILFRETPDGGTKVSLRSNGELDVNALARLFGGGGHVKAAGALIGAPMGPARAQVLEATRAALRELPPREAAAGTNQ